MEAHTALQATVCRVRLFRSPGECWERSPTPPVPSWAAEFRSPLSIQILASHSQVEGHEELAEAPAAVHKLQGRDYQPSTPRSQG